MLEWLGKIKDSVSDAMAYDCLKANVESMQRDNESQTSHIELLKSHVEILTANLAEIKSQLDESRERLSVLETANAQLRKVNTQLSENKKFDVIAGIAFKRGRKKGEYEEEPRCPQCHGYLNLSIQHYRCSAKCNYSIKKQYDTEIPINALASGTNSAKGLKKIESPSKTAEKRKRGISLDAGHIDMGI